jgi:hypothetical protein
MCCVIQSFEHPTFLLPSFRNQIQWLVCCCVVLHCCEARSMIIVDENCIYHYYYLPYRPAVLGRPSVYWYSIYTRNTLKTTFCSISLYFSTLSHAVIIRLIIAHYYCTKLVIITGRILRQRPNQVLHVLLLLSRRVCRRVVTSNLHFCYMYSARKRISGQDGNRTHIMHCLISIMALFYITIDSIYKKKKTMEFH